MKKNEKNELMYEMKKKSPASAVIFSFLIVGLGQCYNGEIAKGALFFFGSIIMWVLLLGWVIWIWSWFDAYYSAQRINRLLALELDIPVDRL